MKFSFREQLLRNYLNFIPTASCEIKWYNNNDETSKSFSKTRQFPRYSSCTLIACSFRHVYPLLKICRRRHCVLDIGNSCCDWLEKTFTWLQMMVSSRCLSDSSLNSDFIVSIGTFFTQHICFLQIIYLFFFSRWKQICMSLGW